MRASVATEALAPVARGGSVAPFSATARGARSLGAGERRRVGSAAEEKKLVAAALLPCFVQHW